MISNSADIITNIELTVTSKYVVTAYIYALKPIKANADFRRNEAHNPRPLIVPKTGHTINLEEPALFNLHLSEFYSSINASKWNERDKRAEIVKL